MYRTMMMKTDLNNARSGIVQALSEFLFPVSLFLYTNYSFIAYIGYNTWQGEHNDGSRVKAGEGDDMGKGFETRMCLEFGMFFFVLFYFLY